MAKTKSTTKQEEERETEFRNKYSRIALAAAYEAVKDAFPENDVPNRRKTVQSLLKAFLAIKVVEVDASDEWTRLYPESSTKSIQLQKTSIVASALAATDLGDNVDIKDIHPTSVAGVKYEVFASACRIIAAGSLLSYESETCLVDEPHVTGDAIFLAMRSSKLKFSTSVRHIQDVISSMVPE